MKSALATSAILVAFASSALVGGVTYLQLVNNGGYTHSGLEVDSVDLRLDMDGNDDWTSTVLTATLVQPEKTLNPRTSTLAPAAWFDGDPPLTGQNAYRNQRSSPSNWPNDFEDDTSISGLLPGGTVTDTAFTSIGWFDTNTDDGADFTLFRFAIRNNQAGKPDLTLTNTGIPVLTITGTHTFRNSAGTLIPFSLTVYQVPEPATMGLLALGGLAGLLRRR